MELKAVTLSDKEMEIEVLGENETFLNPIKQRLLADKEVEIAEYVIEHPFLSIPRVYFRTKGAAKPPIVLKRALKSLLKDYKDLEDSLQRELPKEA